MQSIISTLQRTVVLLTGLLIFKVTVATVWGYRSYFPPDFEADFLLGRERYFDGSYRWAFYVHLASGPVSLLLGLLLISRRFRMRFPDWHRILGRIQATNVLLFVVPSGVWLACFASAGVIAGISFGLLAVLTGTCVVLGWRSAVSRRFADHQRWMSRCFLLLCSAVVIRVIGGVATTLGVDAPWFNPVASWVSWLVPLAVFELTRPRHRRTGRPQATPDPPRRRTWHHQGSSPAMEIAARRSAAGTSAKRG